jgi:hypothetical protein
VALLQAAADEVLTYMRFPSEHWRQIHSTNPLERLNRELARRCDVMGIFPPRGGYDLCEARGSASVPQPQASAAVRRAGSLGGAVGGAGPTGAQSERRSPAAEDAGGSSVDSSPARRWALGGLLPPESEAAWGESGVGGPCTQAADRRVEDAVHRGDLPRGPAAVSAAQGGRAHQAPAASAVLGKKLLNLLEAMGNSPRWEEVQG